MKKIRAGLNNLLGYERNIKRIIETIIYMKRFNLIDETCYAKGNRNSYKIKYKNNVNITSFHYHLNKDGYIYKFEVDRILKDGNILFKCCDKECEGRAILNTRQKFFRNTEKHSLCGLQHDYMKYGYDKYQIKMESRNWCDIQLKRPNDFKKGYIEWHKSKKTNA